jgi:hypothetical protein
MQDNYRSRAFPAGLIGAAVLAAMAGTARASDQVVANCSNDFELRADLTAMQQTGGGTLTFSCGPSTIVLSSVLPSISQNTRIDGAGKITISGANSSRLFVIDSAGVLELDRLVLANASATGDGGAIYNNGSLTVRRSEVRNSVSGLSGGALVTYGPLTIEDSTFHSNRADNGAALYARFAPAAVTIRDSTFHDNEVTDKENGYGGAVFLWDGAKVTIEGVHFYDNRAVQGGAVDNQFSNSSITIRDSLFERNVAGFEFPVTGKASGGAVHSGAGTLSIETTAIVDSDAQTAGAGVYITGGTASIEDSLIRGGFAQGGGAIQCTNGCNLTMRRSTIHASDAAFGGAAHVTSNSTALFENVTFAMTEAGISGGTLYVGGAQVTLSNSTVHQSTAPSGVLYVGGSGTISLRNTIVSGSGASSNCFPTNGSIVSLDGNLSDDDSCNAIMTGLHDRSGPSYDPLLVPSQSSAAFELVYIPQSGSPAIDGGITSGAPSADQRGVPRPQGLAIDIGAVEVGACPQNVVCGDANADGGVAAADALIALRTAVGTGSCPIWRCDFNGDDSVAASDALAILRTAVGQNTTPNCPVAHDCVTSA